MLRAAKTISGSVRNEAYDRIEVAVDYSHQVLFTWVSSLKMLFSEESTSTTLELDEVWSFVLKKAKQSWIWIALCRKTRQVVAYALGDRSKQTCQRLWEAIPSVYRNGHCFTDFWVAYSAVIPDEQHTAVGKETGETAHVERWNNTLRQHLARFVRMTLSFSKSVVMHEACLLLFLHHYNEDRRAILLN